MVSINHQMAETYCLVDDYLKSHSGLSEWRTSPNDEPAFSDAEVITLGLMQGVLGCATLKRAYQIIAGDYASAFPRLCSYKQWIARLHALTPLVGRLIQAALLACKWQAHSCLQTDPSWTRAPDARRRRLLRQRQHRLVLRL